MNARENTDTFIIKYGNFKKDYAKFGLVIICLCHKHRFILVKVNFNFKQFFVNALISERIFRYY